MGHYTKAGINRQLGRWTELTWRARAGGTAAAAAAAAAASSAHSSVESEKC